MIDMSTSGMSPVRFDYAQLAPADAVVVEAAADGIRNVFRRSIPEIGKHLLAAKAVMKHGLFQTWAQSELEIQPRSANRAMQVALFLEGKSDKLSRLPPSVLYQLAAPKTDLGLVSEIVAAAESAVNFSASAVKQRLYQADCDAERISFLADRHKKKSPDQVRKLYEAQREKDHKEQERQETLAELDRQKMRPLVERIVSKVGADIPEMMSIISDWRRRDNLFRVLEEVVKSRSAAEPEDDPQRVY